MADKTLQKHEKSIATIETKLGAIEASHQETQAQILRMTEKIDLEAAGRQKSFEELKELIRSSHALRSKEPGDGDDNSTARSQRIIPLSSVSSAPLTPSHFATLNDIIVRPDTIRSQPPPGEGSNSVPRTQNQGLHPYIMDPQQMGGPFSPFFPFQPHPFQTHTFFPPPSTLNPYAPPLFPHHIQHTVTPTPPTYSTITIPPSTNTMFPPPLYTSTMPQTHTYTSPQPQHHDHFNHRSNQTFSTYKSPKLEFPKFEGHDPRGWVTKCEKFFQLNPPADERTKVLCAAIYLENEADVWYRSVEIEKPQLLWPEFTKLICQRFSTAGYENVVGQFNKLVQKGKVEDYITQFDELKTYVMAQEGFHRESYYVDNFVSGLKEEIAQYLYNQKPKSMQEARDLARGQEHFLTVLDKRYKATSVTAKYSALYQKSSIPVKSNSDLVQPAANSKSSTEGFRKLSMAELTERKQKGLCFHCDQKFEPGHDCRKKKLYLLMGDNSSNCDPDEELALIWEAECPAPDNKPPKNEVKVSLNAMTGSKGACTLKVQGYLKGKLIHILIDSGSTHNFLSQHLAKQLHLRLKPCSPFTVTVANGAKLCCTTTTGDINWQMTGKNLLVISTSYH